MDADLQHDERLLPRMLEAIESGTVDLVVGSRYVAGGGFGDWSSRRIRISGIATRLAHFICKAEIADPLSGFFMCRREVFEGGCVTCRDRDSRFYSTFSPHRQSR